jgi:hypothetical protein
MRWSKRWLNAITDAVTNARAASITISVMFNARLFNLNFASADTAAVGARSSTKKTTTITG